MKDPMGMSLAEAESYLEKLRADLEETEEERMFVLKQTGLHVSAGTVKKFEAEVNDLKAKIVEAEAAVDAKKAEQAEVVAQP